MIGTKTIHIDKIGEVLFRKSRRAKRINISVKPFDGVVVSFPFYVSYKVAEEVLLSKTEWIKKSLSKMKNYEGEKRIYTESSKFSTRAHNLMIRQKESGNISVTVRNGTISVKYPRSQNVTSDEVQSAIKIGIERAIRNEAKEYLPKKVEQLAKKNDFDYNQVFCKNMKSRWGSCSVRNNINLNIHLMQLSDELIDYVVLHELCHTVHKNHSKRFWNKLESVLPNSKLFDKKLREFSINTISKI